MKPTLVVFAREPVMGRAKTRLAAGVGAVHAHRLYRAMILATLRRTADPRWTTVVAVAPDRAAGHPIWAGWDQVGQGGGSLSPRLSRALSRPGPVAVIGTDCPQVRARDIADAFAALRSHDLALGPADDGGFWLIAARDARPDLFGGVRWSTEHALADVAANSRGRVAYLRTLTDVDDVEALRAVRARPGPRTV